MSFAVASPLVQRSLPDWDQVRAACHQSNVGKRLPDALYVHHSGLAQLDPLLHSIVETARSGTLLIQGQDRVWAVGGLWEVTVRGLVFLTIAYYGFMSWSWFEGYASAVCLYGLWIYHNARTVRSSPEVQNRMA